MIKSWLGILYFIPQRVGRFMNAWEGHNDGKLVRFLIKTLGDFIKD